MVELAARGALRQLNLGAELLVRAARAQRPLLPASKTQGFQAHHAEAVGDEVVGERRELAQRLDPQPPQRLDQAPRLAPRQLEPADQRRDGKPSQEVARLRGWDDRLPLRGGVGGEAGGCNPNPHLRIRRSPRRSQHPSALSPVDSTQPIEGKKRLPRPLRLNRGADPLKSAQQQLGQLASFDWIGERGIRD
jgi:hypothetical protein